MLLEAIGLVGGYGSMMILRGVSLAVDAGRVAVVIGPNGAGKSTALKAIMGLIPLREGRVTVAGRPLGDLRPDQIVGAGVGMVPQARNVFPNLTVDENLEMGAYRQRGALGEAKERVYSLFPDLAARRRANAGQLSGGQRQMVAMGRALMGEPRALLLDEPTAGLAPAVVDMVFERILAIRDAGVAVLLVEQNARQALAIADIGYVLANGENRLTDTGPALLADPDVRASLLGGPA